MNRCLALATVGLCVVTRDDAASYTTVDVLASKEVENETEIACGALFWEFWTASLANKLKLNELE